MNITCPKCKSSYKIDPSIVPENGKNIECAKCHDIFFVSRKEEVEGMEKVVNNLKDSIEEWDKKLTEREKEEKKETRQDLGDKEDLIHIPDIEDKEIEKMFRDVIEDMEKVEEETIKKREEEVEQTEKLKDEIDVGTHLNLEKGFETDEDEVDEWKPITEEEIETAKKNIEELTQEIKEQDMAAVESIEDIADFDMPTEETEKGKEEIRKLLEEAREVAETVIDEEKPRVEEVTETTEEEALTEEITEPGEAILEADETSLPNEERPSVEEGIETTTEEEA